MRSKDSTSSTAANVYHPPQKGYQQDALFAGDKVELRGVNEVHQRCEFTFSDGRQCRSQRAQFCAHHASQKQSGSASASLESPELVALCSDLTTATNINRALAQVFLLTAQGRISQKQAVAFGYLSQLLLQTVPGIRSEFVSAFGYHPWEQKLKASLEPKPTEPGPDENDDPTGGSDSSRESLIAANVYQQDELRGVKEDQELSRVNKGITAFFRHEEVEPDDPDGGRETPQQPIDKPIVDRRPFEERVMEPDYDSIVSRGRDLLAGKYSVTPEGRREAQALNTELELMQPPAAKMPKGARASIIEHMKRWIAQKKKPAAKSAYPANMPPALNYYGHPIPLAVPYDELDRGAQFASPTPSRDADSRTPSPRTSPPADKLSAPPNSEISTLKSPVAPVSPPSSQPSASAPAPAISSDPPPTRRPNKPRRSAQGLASESSLRPSPPTFAPELALASNPPNSTAHASDWYTPPAWSRNRKPDPFPNRNEKRKRELRGLSNSKLRHLQHLNSRAF